MPRYKLKAKHFDAEGVLHARGDIITVPASEAPSSAICLDKGKQEDEEPKPKRKPVRKQKAVDEEETLSKRGDSAPDLTATEGKSALSEL